MAGVLSRKNFQLILEICELPVPRVGGAVMADHFPEAREPLLQSGVLSQGPTQTVVPNRTNHEGRTVDAQWDNEQRCYRYFSVDHGGWVKVPDEDLRTYDLNVDWLLGLVAKEMGIGNAIHPHCLVLNHLWELGTAWIGKRKATVLFGRRIARSDVFRSCLEAMRTRKGRPPGVVLTTSPGSPWEQELPGGHRVLPLRDCLSMEKPDFAIDMNVVHGVLTGIIPGRTRSSLHHSTDYSSVTVNGRIFVFRGDKQKQLIESLVRAHERGDDRCRTQELLENIESTSTTLVKFFSGRSDWKDLIGYGNGFCWLKVSSDRQTTVDPCDSPLNGRILDSPD